MQYAEVKGGNLVIGSMGLRYEGLKSLRHRITTILSVSVVIFNR